jgi:hypothetical protein
MSEQHTSPAGKPFRARTITLPDGTPASFGIVGNPSDAEFNVAFENWKRDLLGSSQK